MTLPTPVPLSRALAAEGIGTFALVFFGPGAAVVQAQTGALGHLGVAVVFGLTVTAVIAALAPISGAHINPAATFALTLAGRFPRERVLPYVAAQLLAAALAGFVLLALFGMKGDLGVTVPSGSVAQAFVLELTLTFFLLLVALRSGLPWVVGGVVALEAAMGGPMTGASMNPARSFGPSLASGIWTAHWLYWAAPLMGAGLAVAANHFLNPTEPVETAPHQAQEFVPTEKPT
ncbi:aquaporin [Deinococcus deserti]|uniref:Putative MIP family protein (Major Intrinsic Protein) (Aquaporin) putative membrane protein n=1 Tax=Deinococcus deserti (strain DSM 17065 / CIP 109153 / LMG 22923 / VCD115) TaxID=546414 RepID=C1D3Y0_DEIDV|nr:aquaporin [Deinococcus deserti]ACO48209.1 putative MIP family protein (Major Intrinsic Protein) (aquaporin); putative membrane protein [Deinococcus deserti VCD115]